MSAFVLIVLYYGAGSVDVPVLRDIRFKTMQACQASVSQLRESKSLYQGRLTAFCVDDSSQQVAK